MENRTAQIQQQIIAQLPSLRRFAISIAGTRYDGDDLLQATVERVLIKGAPIDVDIKKWMFRICKNIWIDEVRARQVRQREAQGQNIDIHDKPDGEARIMDSITLDNVYAAMQKLPDEQRVALSLVAVEGLSYKNAAEVLQVPIGTIMSRIARARKHLADLLSPVDIASG